MKRSLWRIARELLLLAVLYVGYSAARLLASDDTALAIQHAKDVLGVERWWHIGVELSWNSFLAEHEFLSVLAGYWYASMHYIVTPLVLVLLWRHSHAHYIKMRRVLVGATTIALGAYIFYPTAPPRIMDGYVDILATTSHWGWWGASASAPRGLGDLTNELAAMPSMHVGWALWCTMAHHLDHPHPVAADQRGALRHRDHPGRGGDRQPLAARRHRRRRHHGRGLVRAQRVLAVAERRRVDRCARRDA